MNRRGHKCNAGCATEILFSLALVLADWRGLDAATRNVARPQTRRGVLDAALVLASTHLVALACPRAGRAGGRELPIDLRPFRAERFASLARPWAQA
jgi:hypothetical protein